MSKRTDFLYFGYGSNLNLKDLRKYERKKFPHREKLFEETTNFWEGIFFLPDYQLQFTVKSPSRNAGVLDVTPKLGHAVAGKLFEVENWDLLDAKEGAPNFYKKIPIIVIDENGKTFDAFTYVVSSKNKRNHVKPNQNYVKIVSEGYNEFGISEKFPWAYENLISASENEECEMIDSMFVYGTLRKQECREKIMNEISHYWKNTSIKAKMYDIGAFPGIVLDEGIVYGEIHKIKKEPNSFHMLDLVEGFTEYGKSSLYHRILINSSQGVCWTYVWNGTTENYKVIESGNWRTKE